MAEQLKEKAHLAHRTGRANTTGVYYSKWKVAHTGMDGPASSAFMQSKEITYTERKKAIRYRYGGLYTAKLAHRYGHANSDKCPLCGQPDGGHHAVSACPALSQPVTARHHKAGRLIMRAIQTGRQGASLVMADVGNEQHCQEDGLQQLPHRIPLTALPTSMPESLKQKLSKHKIPDGMLFRPATPMKRSKYIIIEIKYCRDSDPTPQMDRANQQHTALCEAIKQHDQEATVKIITIPLGVSGAIYTNTLHALKELGVNDRRQKQFTRALSEHYTFMRSEASSPAY